MRTNQLIWYLEILRLKLFYIKKVVRKEGSGSVTNVFSDSEKFICFILVLVNIVYSFVNYFKSSLILVSINKVFLNKYIYTR